jgi:hypothetical protein
MTIVLVLACIKCSFSGGFAPKSCLNQTILGLCILPYLHKLVGSSDQLVGMHFLGDNIGFQG